MFQIKGLKLGTLFAAATFVAACVSSGNSVVSRPGWTVRCLSDAVSNDKRCFAGTFGSPIGADGTPYAGPGIPLQVYFLNGRGPYVQAGWHNFPGRYPLIRFDDDKRALTVPDDGMGGRQASPAIVNRMLTARTARVRFETWPDGPQDMLVLLDGFPAAWGQLKASN